MHGKRTRQIPNASSWRGEAILQRLPLQRRLVQPNPLTPERAVQFFACERLKVAVFENRLILSIRTEQIRVNLANSFASARNRACKHASTNWHGVNATNLFSVESTPPSPLKTQLKTRFDDVQSTIVSLVEALAPPRHHKRGCSKTERRANQRRQDNSVSRRGRNRCKVKAARRPNTC